MANPPKEVERERILQEFLNTPPTEDPGNIPAAILLLDLQGNILSYTSSASDLVNHYLNKRLSAKKNILKIIPTVVLEAFSIQVKLVIESLQIANIEVPTSKKDSLNFKLVPVLNKELKVKKIQVFAKENIQRKQGDREQLGKLLDNASIGLVQTTSTGEVLETNEAANRMFGCQTRDFKENGYENFFVTTDGKLEELLENRNETGEIAGEITAIKNDGSRFPVRIYTSVNINEEGSTLKSTILEDISEEKAQEKALTKTLQILRSLYENHPDAVYSFDLEGKFLDLNKTAARLIEVPVNEMKGENFMSLIQEEDHVKVTGYFKKATEGKEVNYDIGFISKKGTKHLLNVSNFPIVTDEGIVGVYGIARDITAAEAQKQEVFEGRQRLKKIMDQSLDIICTIDEKGKFREVSAASKRILGYEPGELMGTEYLTYVIDEDRQVTEDMGVAIAEGEEITSFSNMYRRKDGGIVPLIWSAKWDETENLTYCVARDASALKEAERKILKERSMLKAIIDNIPDLIFVVDRDHRTILTNKKFYSDYLGKATEADTLGLQPVDYFPKEQGLEIMQDNSRIMEGGDPVINRKDLVYDHMGKKDVILLTKVPLTRDDKEVSGLVGIARNITEVHNLEQEQEFIYKLIGALGTASTFKSALGKTIKILANFLNFEAAEAWELGYDKNNLIRITDYNKKEAFWKGDPATSFKKGEGLPGITWEKRNVQIWQNEGKEEGPISKGPEYTHQREVAIGVPIIFKEEVLAVLTFYGKGEAAGRTGLKELLSKVAVQISNDVQRKITENRLNNMYRYSPNLIAVIGIDGYLKKINPAFIKMFGYTEEELLHTPFTNFLHQQEKETTYERLKEVAAGRSRQNFQNRCRAKNGEWKWISWTPAELLEEEGIVHLFGIDITSIKSVNLELHKYRNIIESSKDAIGLFTLDTQEVFLNSSFQKILGYENAILKGQETIEKMYKGNIIAREIFPALLAGNYWEGDLQIKGKNGELLDYYFSGGPVFNSKNEIIALFGIHTDISERKQYEATLKAYGDRINRILESITDGFFSLTFSGEVTYWNKAAETLTGIPRHSIENMNMWEIFPEAKKLLFFSKYEEALETMKKVSFEEFSPKHNKWFEVNVYPGDDGFSVYFKDITDRRLADNKIKIAKERYDLVAKATREAVYDWDIINGELEWNEAYFELYGDRKINKKNNFLQWLESIHSEERQKVEQDLNLALESMDTKWECEYRIITANKNLAYVLERGFIMRNEAGVAVRMIGSLHDITALKQNERSLEQLNHQLEKNAKDLADSNAELEQFAYIASHDLQEPLRMVTSFLSQLQKKYDAQLDDRARQYIYFATDGAVRMRQILLDLLDYSRAGRLQYSLEEIDLNKMLKDILLLHENSIKESGAIIHYKDLPVIRAAVTPLQRVLSNLISNSIKYSHNNVPPVIEVHVEEQATQWEFLIGDNGIGIDRQYFEKIFVLFQRLHSRDDYSGTGIGLAICKKIVENHGGKIWLESREGKGSTFHFTINKQF